VGGAGSGVGRAVRGGGEGSSLLIYETYDDYCLRLVRESDKQILSDAGP
jgi:hypothetical protein